MNISRSLFMVNFARPKTSDKDSFEKKGKNQFIVQVQFIQYNTIYSLPYTSIIQIWEENLKGLMGNHDLLDIPKIFNNAIPILFSKTKLNLLAFINFLNAHKICSVSFYEIFSSAFIQFSNKEKNLCHKKFRMYRPFFFPFFLSEGEKKESKRYILGDMVYTIFIY